MLGRSPASIGIGVEDQLSQRSGIHVIVVNYRSVTYLRACVSGLLLTEIDSLLVLDNASGRDEIDELRALEQSDSRVHVVESEENVGFGAGVNRAVELGGYALQDHLWILNPDTRVRPDAPGLLSRAIHDGAHIVSPLILTGSPPTVWFAGGAVDERRGVTRHFGEGEDPPPWPSDVFATSFVTGAAPMMSMATWHALGGFREDLFLYWEDADLCRRATDAGLVMRVVPDARVWHAQGASSADSSGGNGSTFYYYNQRNRILVCGPRAGAWRLVAVTGLRETLRLLVRPLVLERSGRLAKLSASTNGVRDGLRGRTGPGPTRPLH